MRLPRMTTRRMMLAVAVLAVLMGVGLSPRWRLCFEEAAYHTSEEQAMLQEAAASMERAAAYQGNTAEAAIQRAHASALRAKAGEHVRSRRQCERAAFLPWVELPAIAPRRESHGTRR